MNEKVDLHTDHLAKLVSYERNTEELIKWQKTFNISNYEDHNKDVGLTQKLKGIEDFIAELKIRAKKVENELVEYRKITQKLDGWIEGSNITIANVVKTTLQSTTYVSDVEVITTTLKPARVEALTERTRPRQTPEQTIFEQMKLMVANLTTEMAVMRNYKLPRLESKVAAIEAKLPVN